MSTPTTFPRFLELPVELQLQVFRDVASPDGVLDLKEVLFWGADNFLGPLYHLPVDQITFAIFINLSTIMDEEDYSNWEMKLWKITMQARLALMSTCQTAIQVALEAWRKDVQAINVGVYYARWRLYTRAQQRLKDKLIQILDDAIENLKSGGN